VFDRRGQARQTVAADGGAGYNEFVGGSVMPQVNIPDSLFREVERVLPNAVSPDEFIVKAVREKVASEGQKQEFYRLSNQTRAAMTARGLTESDILKEFDSARSSQDG
jgi:hypothetical protein